MTARDRDGREIVDIWTLPLDETTCSRLLEELVLAVGLHSRMEEVFPRLFQRSAGAIDANAD